MTSDAPPLQRDASGQVDVDSVPDVIEWFLNYDQRVGIVRHPSVEEVFQWKQQHTAAQGEEIFQFKRAEDRLAIGIIQALADNSDNAVCTTGLDNCSARSMRPRRRTSQLLRLTSSTCAAADR